MTQNPHKTYTQRDLILLSALLAIIILVTTYSYFTYKYGSTTIQQEICRREANIIGGQGNIILLPMSTIARIDDTNPHVAYVTITCARIYPDIQTDLDILVVQ